MKIAFAIAFCFLSLILYSPLEADSRDPDVTVARPISSAEGAPPSNGFWDRLFHWKRESDEPAHPSVKRLDSGSRRIAPNRPLVLAITAGGSARRAAALRFAEKGRQLLAAGAYQRALIYFEKALGLDANPYFYYYLARAHYHLAHTQESLRFLDVAESLLSDQSDWIAEVATLRAKFQAAAGTSRRSVHPIALPVR
jgi:tetratricopeptide (TPR) repeat protein